MTIQTNPVYWDTAGTEKTFTDPFFLDQLTLYVKSQDSIFEYGCGYGRLLNLLWEHEYCQSIGFDFSPNMIKKGKELFPHLNLNQISYLEPLPLKDGSAQLAILSTVLCCNPSLHEQQQIIDEMYRCLAPNGVLYVCDFLITHSEKYLKRYFTHFKPEHENFGVYQTREGLFVRHHTVHGLFHLLRQFDILWLKQVDDQTMNGNAVRTCHLIAQKKQIPSSY